ncbi:tyrosyl-DNA phosphodiesterase I [Aspergillus crustosus]
MDDQPDRPAKRPKLSSSNDPNTEIASNAHPPNLTSLHRSITPPPSRPRRTPISPHHHSEKTQSLSIHQPQIIPSPIQLTHIRDFSASSVNNVDTVRLRDILGDPMIRECWQFNYLFDVDFLMNHFDEDVKSLVTVKVVHGSWKRESENRIRIDEACERYSNVEPIVAYMPEPFGTHHSKMMILLRHNDSAQIIIHTANMIPGDWANMSQAIWRSPLLPLSKSDGEESKSMAWGSGARFKRDLLAYLKEYGIKKTGPLVEQLARYNFDAVKAALIASVPSKLKISGSTSNEDGEKTSWGWVALKDALKHVPLRESDSKTTPHIVAQMSSIATLGQTDKWLKDVFFDTLAPSVTKPAKRRPRYSIIFPTAEEIRRSLNGYGSGGSIHVKLQSAAQQKQLQYLRPYLRYWAGDVADKLPSDTRDAGRSRAAPHIKTYIRFADSESMDVIDWALVTSANLSTQAWGAAANAGGEVRICSWEIGLLVWPELFMSEAQVRSVAMVPCFKKDDPDPSQLSSVDEAEPTALVGFRMPYDLPLTSYSADDVPWCATMPHRQPDWLGQTWEG